jgi:hypothetical protein
MFQEVLVRFAGFGPEEDEWVNVRKHVRQRSLPCESSECVAVLPGDLILCFQVAFKFFFSVLLKELFWIKYSREVISDRFWKFCGFNFSGR